MRCVDQFLQESNPSRRRSGWQRKTSHRGWRTLARSQAKAANKISDLAFTSADERE